MGDETDPQLEALLKGSHNLRTLELGPLPADIRKLPQMLALKPNLEALTLGKGSYGDAETGKLPAQILIHAPGLKTLTLDKPKFNDWSFLEFRAAFSKSALTEFNLYEPKMKARLGTCDELLDGVSQAPNLSSLGLESYGQCAIDEALLKAFAKNPAARTVNVLGKRPTKSLDSLLIAINQDRANQKWESIRLVRVEETRVDCDFSDCDSAEDQGEDSN